MRNLLIAAACGLVLGAGVAAAGNREDNSPEARAYLGFSFGGQKAMPHDLHYGLRIDQDARLFGTQRPAMAPLMQFDFDRVGFTGARLNGLPMVSRSYRLQQTDAPASAEPAPDQTPPAPESAPADSTMSEPAPAESAPAESAAASEEPAEAVEEKGFFGKIGAWFGGLFGGDDEEETETASADTEETAEGTFMGYDAADWATLAVGAVGLGYVASEVTNGDDDADPGTTPPPDDGGTTLPGGLVIPGGGGGTLLPADPTAITSLAMTGPRSLDFLPMSQNATPEYQEWMDGGTGHMGDLSQR